MVFGSEVTQEAGLINCGFLFLFNEGNILFSSELGTTGLVVVGCVSGTGIGGTFWVLVGFMLEKGSKVFIHVDVVCKTVMFV